MVAPYKAKSRSSTKMDIMSSIFLRYLLLIRNIESYLISYTISSFFRTRTKPIAPDMYSSTKKKFPPSLGNSVLRESTG